MSGGKILSLKCGELLLNRCWWLVALANVEKQAHARDVRVEPNWKERGLDIAIIDDGTVLTLSWQPRIGTSV
jgi:hypothetical protein